MKYIIEVEQIPGTELYKAKNFNTLIFDQYGLDHLEKYDVEFIEKCIKTAINSERYRIKKEIVKILE